MSLMLYSVNTSSGVLEDSVPSDEQAPGNAILSQFSAVSEHMNLIAPLNSVSGDPSYNNPIHSPFLLGLAKW